MNPFEKKFMSLLEQDLEDPSQAIPAPDIDGAPLPGEEPDLGNTLDAVDDVEDNPGVSWRKDQNNNQRGTIEGWIGRITEFTEFLNGTDGSMQRELADADCDTMFNDVGRSETKKITRIAQDLSALEQSLKGYLISNDEE